MGAHWLKMSHNSDIRVEMLKFDATFKYTAAVVIIDFGPDDEVLKQNDARLFY